MENQQSFQKQMAGMRAKHAFQWWGNLTSPKYHRDIMAQGRRIERDLLRNRHGRKIC